MTAPPAKEPGGGSVVVNFEEGSLFLKNGAGEYFRLEWAKGAPADRRRALPAGDYTLTHYRIVRRDEKGSEWFIAATSRAIRKLTVKAGEELRVELTEFIGLNFRARVAGNGAVIQSGLSGEPCAGLSIYRDCKRIDLGYKIIDPAGKELAAGMLEYG